MLKWVAGFFDRAFVVIGALAFSQAPVFFQQYTQHLSGHVAELKIQMANLTKAASLSGKSLQEYVQKFVGNQDVDFFNQGLLMQGMIDRYAELSNALTKIEGATVFSRPFVFLGSLNYDIAKNTAEHFQFGIPLNVEGAIYGMVGIGVGYVMFSLFRKIFRLFGSAARDLFRRKPSALDDKV